MTHFGEPTDSMIRDAYRDQAAGYKLKKKQRILLLLADGEWHSIRELTVKCTHEFSARKKELIDAGVSFDEPRRDKDAPRGEMWYDYRLICTGPQRGLF